MKFKGNPIGKLFIALDSLISAPYSSVDSWRTEKIDSWTLFGLFRSVAAANFRRYTIYDMHMETIICGRTLSSVIGWRWTSSGHTRSA